jgi:aldose 1-epimerase
MNIQAFGKSKSGDPISLCSLASETGMVARITNYGAIVTELHVPDSDGHTADVVLGFDSIDPYLAGHPFFGAIVGRTAGRISGGRLEIDGRHYSLERNEPPNHLHGGAMGWDKRIWTMDPIEGMNGEAVRLGYLSPDGEAGYPGNVQASVVYSLNAANEFRIDYEATTDAPTPVNLTNHSYFNLSGEGSGDIRSHELQILSDTFYPVDDHLTLDGRRLSVDGQANDFRKPVRLGDRLDDLFERHGDVYEIKRRAAEPTLVARVNDPASGRRMEVLTTESCLQFYTSKHLDGTLIGKSGRPYPAFSGLCLECHQFADAVNHEDFDSMILRPGETYRQTTVYRFPRPSL